MLYQTNYYANILLEKLILNHNKSDK